MSLSFYKSPIAQWVGADIAWLPGLLVPGLLHVLAEKPDSALSLNAAR
jgi:hypothetical protein